MHDLFDIAGADLHTKNTVKYGKIRKYGINTDLYGVFERSTTVLANPKHGRKGQARVAVAVRMCSAGRMHGITHSSGIAFRSQPVLLSC
jgi:hypothetical protein